MVLASRFEMHYDTFDVESIILRDEWAPSIIRARPGSTSIASESGRGSFVRKEDFDRSSPGTLVKVGEHGWAYLPAPLPPILHWPQELVTTLAAATLALGRLDGIGRTLPNPHLLIRPFIRREAVLSSRIEGTQASLSDLFLYESAPTIEPEFADVREVANYVCALEFGLHHQSDVTIGLRMIRELHAQLLDKVRGQELTPGEFRKDQNWIGPPGCSMRDATFVPPPPLLMLDALESLDAFIKAPSTLPPLVRISIIHYQFEAIHPFRDGNGRVGRLLITLLLCADAMPRDPLVYLSAFFERNRQEYYDRLLRVSQKGEWLEWIAFFLQGVAEQANDAVHRSDRMRNLRESFRHRFQEARSSALLLKLIDELFSTPVISITRASTQLGVTYRTASQNISLLEKAGILREITGQKRNRTYVAEEILRILE
jgi:Fic family protein